MRGRKALLVVLLVVAMLLTGLPLTTSTAAEGDDTPLVEPLPVFRGSLARNGSVYGTVPMSNRTLWLAEVDSPVVSSPVVTRGKLYVGTMGGSVLCLNAYTGHQEWEYVVGEAVESSPAVDWPYLYVGADDYRVYCLDVRDGSHVWNISTGGEVKSSPIVVDDRLFVGSNDFFVYCLDTEDGRRIWNFSTGGWVYSSPAYYDGRVFFGSCDGNMYCVNADNGSEVWHFEAEYIPATPAVTERYVVFGAYDDNVYYLERTTGRMSKYVTGPNSGVYSSAALFDFDYGLPRWYPTVIVGDNNGTLHSFNYNGSRFPWFGGVSFEGPITSSPLAVHRYPPYPNVYAIWATGDGHLHMSEGTYGMIIYPIAHWDIKLGSSIESSPFLYHDKVYVGAEREDGTGVVACIGEIIPGREVYIDFAFDYPDYYILPGYYPEGYLPVNVRVFGVEPDRVEVTVEGVTKTADLVTIYGDPCYQANFTITGSDGMRDVLIEAYAEGEVVAELRTELMGLVEGGGAVEVVIEEPADGSRLDGVVVVRGTASSDYGLILVRASCADDDAYIKVNGLENWTIALDTSELSDGEHVLQVWAADPYRYGGANVTIFIGEEDEDGLGFGTRDVVAVGILVALAIAILVTRRRGRAGRPS